MTIAESVNIVRLGYVEMLVTDLEKAHELYVDFYGFIPAAQTDDAIFLRGVDERSHHTFILRKSDQPGIASIGLRVEKDAELDIVEQRFQSLGLATKWLDSDEYVETGRQLLTQDPFGHPVTYYAEMTQVEWAMQRYHEHRGIAPKYVDHVNALVTDADAGAKWWMDELGFKCSEYTESEPPESRIWGSWLYRKPSVHDVAVMTGPGPSLHHVGIMVKDEMSIIRLCDKLGAAGKNDMIERGPGRHGISNAFFLYLRDFDGNRIEFYTSDYMTSDPNFVPKRWSLDDPTRQTLWGAPPPRRWFEESMAVRNVVDGSMLPMGEPDTRAIPTYVGE